MLSTLFLRRSLKIPQCPKQYHKKLDMTPVGQYFNIVYQLPPIMACSLINKVKKYQSIAFGISGTVSMITSATGNMNPDNAIIICSVGLASTLAVFLVGQAFTNLLGFVYISKDRRKVKLSYLNFWGDRIDKLYNIEDVRGFSETNNFVYKTLITSNPPEKYKLNLRYGEIVNSELFKTVFKLDPDSEESVG